MFRSLYKYQSINLCIDRFVFYLRNLIHRQGFTNTINLPNNNLKFYTAAAASKRGEYSERKRKRKRGKEMENEAVDGDELEGFLILSLSHTQGKIIKLPVTDSYSSR